MARTLLRIAGLWLLHLTVTVASFVVLLGLVTRERPRGAAVDFTLKTVRIVNGLLIEPGRSVLIAWEGSHAPATSLWATAGVLGLNSLLWAAGLCIVVNAGARWLKDSSH